MSETLSKIARMLLRRPVHLRSNERLEVLDAGLDASSDGYLLGLAYWREDWRGNMVRRSYRYANRVIDGRVMRAGWVGHSRLIEAVSEELDYMMRLVLPPQRPKCYRLFGRLRAAGKRVTRSRIRTR